MCLLCLLLFSLSTAFIACIAMFAALYFSKGHGVCILQEEVKALTASSGQLGAHFEGKIVSMLDERLDKMVDAFKAKIPLAGMFLSKDKEASLKELARGELLKLVPAVKEKLLSGDVFSAAGGPISTLMDKVWKRLCCRVISACALTGFILGAVQFCFLYLLGYLR